MAKLPKLPKRSIKFYWSFTYSIILVLSLLLMLVIYNTVQQTIRRQSIEINESAVSQVVQQIDSRMTETASTLYELQQSYTLSNLGTYYGSMRDLPPYDLYQGYLRLGDAQLMLEYVKEIMVYYPRTQTVISSVAAASAEIYHQVYIEPKGLSYEGWLDIFSQVKEPTVVPVRYGDNQSADVIYSIRPHRNGSVYIAVIDPGKLVQDITRKRNDLYLVDHDGKIITGFASNQADWDDIGYQIPEFPQHQEILTQEHDSLMVSCMQSDAANWYYVASTPLTEYFSGYYWIQRFTAIGIVFYLFAAFAIIYMSIRSQYRPVRKLIEDAQGDIHYVPSRGNEFIFISDSLEGMRNKQSEVLTQYRDHEWCELVLRRIITGEQKLQENVQNGLMEYLEQNFALFAEENGEKRLPQCFISAFYICDYGDRTGDQMRNDPAFPELEDYYTYSRMVLYKTIGRQISLSNIPAEVLHTFHIPIYNVYIFVVFSQVENAQQLMNDISRQICEEVNTQVYMETKYVTGAHTYSVDQLSEGYEDVLRMITQQEQSQLQSQSEVYDLPYRSEGRPEILPTERRQYLERIIRTNDIAQLRRELIALFRSYTLIGTATILQSDFSLFLSAVSEFAMELIQEMHLDKDVYYARIARCVNDIMSGDNPIHILRRILRLFQNISNDFHSANLSTEETQHQSISSQVRAYIDQNYSDPNLSLSTLSIHFSVNTTSLSRIFRENTEMGIPDYINRVRINQAKVILCSDSYTNLDDLAERVGYNNTKTLIRAFKRFEDITPGQYKELYKDNPKE